MEEALVLLNKKDPEVVNKLWSRVSEEIESRSMAYVNRYLSSSMQIGAILFDRAREIRWFGTNGLEQIAALGVNNIR